MTADCRAALMVVTALQMENAPNRTGLNLPNSLPHLPFLLRFCMHLLPRQLFSFPRKRPLFFLNQPHRLLLYDKMLDWIESWSTLTHHLGPEGASNNKFSCTHCLCV